MPPYDPDFEAFCASVRVLGGEYGTAVTDIVKTLLRQAAGKGIALDGAEDMLPPPDHSVSRDDFVAVLDAMKKVRASRKDGLPDRAAKVFQSLENNLRDFPTLGKIRTDRAVRGRAHGRRQARLQRRRPDRNFQPPEGTDRRGSDRRAIPQTLRGDPRVRPVCRRRRAPVRGAEAGAWRSEFRRPADQDRRDAEKPGRPA